jgi:hypothetical protein
MEGQYNLRSPAVKRLMREAKELRNPTYQYYAQPLEVSDVAVLDDDTSLMTSHI